MPLDLISSPWTLQVTIASGYAAYALAYTGLRAHHGAVDVAFATLVFGLVATAVTYLADTGLEWGPVASASLAFLLTTVTGLIWRKVGRRALRSVLRLCRISNADNDPSAWKALFDATDHDVSQIAVKLDDGTWLRCDDTRLFADAPFGPCLLGESGDIVLYLTHEDRPDGTCKALKSVRDANYGDRLTYVPKDRIARVTVRHQAR